MINIPQRYVPSNLTPKDKETQIKANTNVSTIIDVGVHKGTPTLYSVFKDKHFILV